MIFRTRALEILGRVYRFGEAKVSPEQIDLSAPIQPVHDVSRAVEVGSAFGTLIAPGLALIEDVHVHAMAGSLNQAIAPHATLAALTNLGLPSSPLEIDAYLIDAWAHCDTDAATTFFTSAMFYPQLPGMNAVTAPRLIVTGTTMTDISNAVASGTEEASGFSNVVLGFPRFVPTNTVLASRSTVGAAAQVFFSYLFFFGPRGVRPPGAY